jgi:LuxR family transcriptional regulator
MGLNIRDYNSSKKSCLRAASAIRNISEPFLASLGIASFTFQRLYRDGKRLYFANCEKWIDHFYNNNYFFSASFNKYKDLPDTKVMLWARWPWKEQSFYKFMKDAKDNFQYENGLYVCKGNINYIDAFSFRGKVNDSDINFRYLANFPTIEKFIDYFLIKANSLIRATYNKKSFIIPEQNELFTLTTTPFHPTTLILSTDLEESNLFLDNNGIKFSKRESECIYAMYLGNSAKEIARQFNISIRTVEYYFNNIRQKLGCTSKSQILSMLLKTSYNKKLILNYIESL